MGNKRKPSVYATMVNELRVTQGALTEIHGLLKLIGEQLRTGRHELVDATGQLGHLVDGLGRLRQAIGAVPTTIQVEVANVCPACQEERYETTKHFNEFLPGDQAEAKKAA